MRRVTTGGVMGRVNLSEQSMRRVNLSEQSMRRVTHSRGVMSGLPILEVL